MYQFQEYQFLDHINIEIPDNLILQIRLFALFFNIICIKGFSSTYINQAIHFNRECVY
jgi:hypothetical protein